MRRRDWFKFGIAAAVTAGFVDRLLSADEPARIGHGAVYYGTGRAQTAQEQQALQKVTATLRDSDIDPLVVHPYVFPKPPSAGSAAYVSLTGANQTTQAALLNSLRLKKALLVEDPAAKTPKYVEDPHGPGSFIIDYRKKEAATLMRAYIMAQVTAGYKNIFFDAFNSAVELENKEPEKFKGLTAETLKFIETIAKELRDKKPPVKITINGGNAKLGKGEEASDDHFKSLMKSVADIWAIESQATGGTGKFGEKPDAAYTKALVATALKENPKLTIFAIELGIPADRNAEHRRAATEFFAEVLGENKTPVRLSVTNGFTEVADLTAQLEGAPRKPAIKK